MRKLDVVYDFFTVPEFRSVSEFAESMEKRINGAEMLALIEQEKGPFKDRKEFCEAFGIGESTLSGWLKGDRIPKLAKLCIGLLHVSEVFTENYAHAQKRLKAIKNADRIVRDGQKYMIVSFKSHDKHRLAEEVAEVGTVSAREIPDEETARRLISHQEVKDTLAAVFNALMQAEMFDDPEDPLLKDVEHHIGPIFQKEGFDTQK